MDDVLERAKKEIERCPAPRRVCSSCATIDALAAEVRALRADLVWAVRGYVRPIDDGQRLAIGIDPQTLFTRMVEWDGTDADILRAVREARER